MKLDRHVDGESFHGFFGLTAVGAEPGPILGTRTLESTPPRPPFVGIHVRFNRSGDAQRLSRRGILSALPTSLPAAVNRSVTALHICN